MIGIPSGFMFFVRAFRRITGAALETMLPEAGSAAATEGEPNQ